MQTPESKINWSELIESTEDFVDEYWSEISSEYIQRYCDEVKAIDPFSGEEVVISADASDPASIEVVGGEWPEFFKTKEDYRWVVENEWDEVEFLLNAKGDYGKEEIETVESWKLSQKSG